MGSFHGRTAIGILIMQDIFAVVFLSLSMQKIPSIWILPFMAALLAFRPLLFKMMNKAGHGEVFILFGIAFAFIGALTFTSFGLKGDLGALIFGLVLARSPKASELSKTLMGFKDLFLVGFFLNIGLTESLSWSSVGLAAFLLVLVPLKTALFFGLFTRFRMRAQSSLMASFSLSNYSEFGLIVGAVAVTSGWLPAKWMITIAVALAFSFLLASPLNALVLAIFSKTGSRLKRFEIGAPREEEEPINPGDAKVVIFGMGRIGTGSYEKIHKSHGDVVVGVDADAQIVEAHQKAKRRVILGDVTSSEFWGKITDNQIEVVMLALPNQYATMSAVEQLNQINYKGKIAAIARFPEEVEELKAHNVSAVYDYYIEVGVGFAEQVCEMMGNPLKN